MPLSINIDFLVSEYNCIGHIRRYLNHDTAELMVHAFITSRVDIGTSLLFGITKTQIKRLQRIQNSAARLITLTKSSAHITPVLSKLHWLPVEQRIIYKIALFVFKNLNNVAPVYLLELVRSYNPVRQAVRSSDQNLCEVCISRNQWGRRSLSCACSYEGPEQSSFFSETAFSQPWNLQEKPQN